MAFRKKISRAKFLSFSLAMPKCVVAMEACASAHHWARQIGELGHEVRLIAPIYVKPFVKRNKNDAADAEAIAEAASRPTMRFVAVKSVEKQAAGWRSRHAIFSSANAPRPSMRCAATWPNTAWWPPTGACMSSGLSRPSRTRKAGFPPPSSASAECSSAYRCPREQIALLERELRERARADDTAKRLMTIPGIGVICATAMEALAPPPESFAKGRDFAAWLGLTPKQNSSGGKTQAGRNVEDGPARSSPVARQRRDGAGPMGCPKRAPDGSWLARMMKKKPRLVVAVALANRTARIAWALMAKGGVYRASSPVAPEASVGLEASGM